MASGSPPDNSTPAFQGPYSEPRSRRWPPRQYSASLDADLSLAAEVQRAEGQVSQRSLLNNLGWSFPSGSQASSSKKSAAKKKGKHFEQVKLPSKAISDSPPSVPFTRKRHHTPATIPRTRLPPGTPASERLAMSSLRQQLFYEDAEVVGQKTTRTSQQSSLSPANNERRLPAQSRTQTSSNLPVLETNETDSRELAPTDGGIKSVNTPLIISRLTQVRDFLKQATAMFATLQSPGVSELRSSELSEQAIKIARLIKQLKQQEQAYVELLQRSVAVEHDSTLENTPSLSLQSLTEEEKSESASIRDEELQGLRQQHVLLKKMLEQQQQLKELQTRHAALLTLQRDAEIRLAEAEEEDRQVSSDVGAEGGECEPSRSRGGTETVQDLHLDTTETQRNERDGASILDDSRFTPEEQELMNLLRRHKERWRAADSEDEKDKDERENHQRPKKKNQPGSTTLHPVIPVASLEVADNEEAALALANATQERLELENKLMVLEAKKEQMDTLLQELQSLREAQLRKESLEAAGGATCSVNESKQEEDEPLATTSQKLDDERILEALEVHEKLQKLQEVRDRLKQLRDLIGHYQPEVNGPSGTENATHALPVQGEPVEITSEPTELEGAVGGAAAPLPTGAAAANAVTDQEFNSIEWMLSAGIDDPDLFGKIRQLQEAQERVAHLFKQTNENTQASTSLANNEGGIKRASIQTQTTEEESDAETQTETDGESAVSGGNSSVNTLAWQDDPEFQAKVRKLNSAKQKLKQLQQLVKKIQQFPESSPTLPAELAELSFDEDDYAEENENDEDDDEGEEEEEERDEEEEDDDDDDDDDDDEDQNKSNRSETSDEDNLPDRQVTEDGGFTAGNAGIDQEAVYQKYLQKQTAELQQLQQERQRLLEVQEELSRLTQHSDAHKTVATQTTKTIPQKSEAEVELTTRSSICTTDRTGGSKTSAAQNLVQQERSTQTPFYGSSLREARSIDSSEPPRARPSALVWSELRRQRELHEEKLKKRKQKILEKRKKAGLDDVSEGGTYSVRSGRSGDMDEGFGVSMMSADITTATWGGSTQPSSTQNDSAVSADESDEENQPGDVHIPVEVEDEYPDGIVQAEEEEEERLEPETFSGDPEAVFRSRERVPRLSAFRESIDDTAQPSSGKKRKLDGTALSGGVRKRDRERGLTFEDWPRTFYFDRNSRGRIRQENFTSADQLIKEREQEQFNVERQVWEQHCEQLHQEVSNLTSLCNGLLRDQQMLVSTIINRGAGTSPSPNAGLHNIPGRVTGLGGNPFEQYQQRQQEAYQGLQSFFDQQRYLQQQYQMLQSLNQCYLQLQQQHQDMAFLQQQFQQLFSHNISFPVSSATSPQRPQTVTPSGPPSLYPSFYSLPSQSSATQSFPSQPSYSAPLFSQSPFTGSIQQPSSAHVSVKTTWAPTFGQAPCENSLPTNIDALFTNQAADKHHSLGNVNSGTGIPSQRTVSYQGNLVEQAVSCSTSGIVKPLVVREAGTSKEGAGLASTTTLPNQTYDPSSYTETGTTNVGAPQVGETKDVIGRTFPTPLRASAVASLAKKDKSAKNPAGFDLARNLGVESVETSSKASSVPGDGHDVAKISWQEADRASEAGSEFSLFEALRDSIYSEVATLISLNESRPHFLLELFRELQLLTSDYLRQRALYALQDLVTRFLTEDSLGAEGASLQQARFQEWLGSNSELTPSETVETFEDEEIEVKENAVPAETVTEGIYDYVENVESGSTLSTPTSSHTGEAPFASEGLGDTVIHLDQALSRMREYERLRTEGRLSEVVSSSSHAKDKSTKDDVTTSSAGDVGSESSISDVQYPRINTQALDHLIKSIMSEVIPYLNEHMEDSCTSELLGYVRNLVLSRIQVNEEQEFGRFFHKQLATILQDSLARFTDRKMKDCGEDMLVDMSEILFNELAFFRLMQDLDGTPGASGRPKWRQGYASSTDTGTGQEGDKEDGEESEDKDEHQPEDSAVEEGGRDAAVSAAVEREEAEGEEEDEDSSNESSLEDSGAEDEGADDERQEGEEDALPISKEEQEAEEEELGKARDDVMASQFEERPSRLPGNNSQESPQCVKLELSASEFKPFSSTGSGEEDGEESFDDSEARQKLEEYVEGTAAAANKDPTALRESGNSESDGNDNDDDGAPQDEQRQAVEAAAEAASADGVSSYLHNGQVGNSHDHTEVTVDDLPTKLTGLTEADLQARIAEEQSRTGGSPAVLAHIDGLQELAGDPESLREPDGSERPVNGVEYDLDK